MKIKYTEASPKFGQIEHIDNRTAHILISAGFAEAVPYKNFVEYMNATAATGSDPSNVNPPAVAGVTWEIGALLDGQPVIYKTNCGEKIRFVDADLAAHHGAPEFVLQKFRNLLEIKNGAEGARVRIEQAKTEQYAREQQEKTARWGVLAARA